MISADSKHSPTAEKIEIAHAGAIEKILTGPPYESQVVSDRLKNPHHHAIHVARM
jgi:hypothetical protein